MKPLLLTTITAVLFVGSAQADSKPYKGKVHQIPGKIEAEHYDEGAEKSDIVEQPNKEVQPSNTLKKFFTK